MVNKEKITQEIDKIIEEGKEIDERIINFVKADFHQTMKDLENAEQSLKQATHSTLSGIESSLFKAEYKAENLMMRVAETLANVSQEITTKSVTASRHYADEAKASFNKVVESTSEDIDKIEEKTLDEMRLAFAALHNETEAEKARLKEVSEGIKDFVENKSQEMSDKTKTALLNVSEKVKDELETITRTGEEFSQKILTHSRAEVSSWLAKLKDKVDKKNTK